MAVSKERWPRRRTRLRRIVALAVLALAIVIAAVTAVVSYLQSRPQNNVAWASKRIKHIVLILEENRSFDNVFGRFPGARGPAKAKVNIGGKVSLDPLIPEPYYLWHDIGHDLSDGLAAIDHGRMDGFSHETYSDVSGDRAAYQQLTGADIPNLYTYARHYTLSDRTFSPMPGPTFPTHLFTVAAQDGGVIGNPQHSTGAWGCDASPGTYVLQQIAPGHVVNTFPCFTFTTLTTTLNAAHRSWTYYAAPPSNLGYIWSTLDAIKPVRRSAQWATNVKDEQSFEADARAGRLPAFSWVTPRAIDSMHPPDQACPGENWIVNKVNAVMQGPDWSSTLIVVAWDDWGGYYDHVPPPAGDGIRVPLLAISPYAGAGTIAHTVYTFNSVLKTAEVLWKLPSLTSADRDARSLLGMLNVAQSPRAPLILQPRSCLPALTQQTYHDLLDQQIGRVLAQMLRLPLTTIEARHRSQTLSQIARDAGANPAAVVRALQTVTAAWWQGEDLLQLASLTTVTKNEYLEHRAVASWFNSSTGPRLFPLPPIAPARGP
ncbi:MAG TPA: alkaline phosphatase family protein [Chloroflexota bacterium]|nr:alkaline phosphatase family protein [Chloroflexota bacterium]